MAKKFPSLALAAELIIKGWIIVEDVEPSKFKVKDLDFVSFLENGQESISGEEMRQRAVFLKANLGLADAKDVLEHQAEIPVHFRGKYLLFPGTLFDTNHITCLCWLDGKWQRRFLSILFDYDNEDFLVRCKSSRNARA